MNEPEEELEESIEIIEMMGDYFAEMKCRGRINEAWIAFLSFFEVSLAGSDPEERSEIKRSILQSFKIVGDEVFEDGEDYLTRRREIMGD